MRRFIGFCRSPLRLRYPIPGLVVTPEELAWFLDYFTRHFYVTTLAAAWRHFRARTAPRRPLLALTFDDGQLDNFVYALPVLNRFGVKASFYLPTQHIDCQKPLWHDRLGFALRHALESDCIAAVQPRLDGPLQLATVGQRIEEAKRLAPSKRAAHVNEIEQALRPGEDSHRHFVPAWSAMMSWTQVRALSDAGHEIGSHSLSHPLLPQCTQDEVRDEVTASKLRIEQQLGKPVETFCYPNGDTSDWVSRAVLGAGYQCAVTTRWGSNSFSQAPMELQRFDINPEHARRRTGELSEARLSWRISDRYSPV